MKQSLYEKIRTVVESGQIAITQNRSGWVRLRSSMCEFWDIRCSDYQETIEKCHLTLWQNYTTQQWLGDNQENWERYIWIYERPLWRPSVWDKVQVLNNYDSVGYEEWAKEFVGKPLTVYSNGYLYCVLTVTEYDYLEVPYDCIAPRVEIDTI